MKIYVVFIDEQVEGVFDSMNLAWILMKVLETKFPTQKVEFKVYELNEMPDL